MSNGELSREEFNAFIRWYLENVSTSLIPGFPTEHPTKKEVLSSPIYERWIRAGKPIVEKEAREVSPVTPTVAPLSPRGEEEPKFGLAGLTRAMAEREAAGVTLGGEFPEGIPPKPTGRLEEGQDWRWNPDMGRWEPRFVGVTAFQQQQIGLEERGLELREEEAAGFPTPTAPPPTDIFGRTATWNSRLGQWNYPPNFGQRPADQPAPITPFQQQQFGLQEQQLSQQQAQQEAAAAFQQQQLTQQQQQFGAQLGFQQQQVTAQQAEEERRFGAQLAANPINWLQYQAYTGEQPVIQPWMIPLGFQNVGGNITPQGLQVGQPIPGAQVQAGQQSFAGLPQLTTPSAQLQARWGPTAQAQFLGYRQARTGATPEETQFRLGSTRAPTGSFSGFSRFR